MLLLYRGLDLVELEHMGRRQKEAGQKSFFFFSFFKWRAECIKVPGVYQVLFGFFNKQICIFLNCYQAYIDTEARQKEF